MTITKDFKDDFLSSKKNFKKNGIVNIYKYNNEYNTTIIAYLDFGFYANHPVTKEDLKKHFPKVFIGEVGTDFGVVYGMLVKTSHELDLTESHGSIDLEGTFSFFEYQGMKKAFSKYLSDNQLTESLIEII